MSFLRVDQLPAGRVSREFVGRDHGAPMSIYFVDAPPGRGPMLHTHPYVETIIVLEGRATVTLGTQQREVSAGEIVIVPAEMPHRFVNSGAGVLRQIDIHASAEFIQTDLE
jgi:quercetin dioxygenase-like cupin family protein